MGILKQKLQGIAPVTKTTQIKLGFIYLWPYFSWYYGSSFNHLFIPSSIYSLNYLSFANIGRKWVELDKFIWLLEWLLFRVVNLVILVALILYVLFY
jgi:hypothetical protein